MVRALLDHLNQLDPHLKLKNAQSVGGGCISQAYRVLSEKGSFFLKVNRLDLLEMFETEYLGLNEMLQSAAIKIPKPILYGDNGGIPKEISFSGFSKIGSQTLRIAVSKACTLVSAGTQPESMCSCATKR